MSSRDPLIAELNQDGYQATWIVQTGLVPPDVYSLEQLPSGRRLLRRGALSHYLPAAAALPLSRGLGPDIQHHRTSQHKYGAVFQFFRSILRRDAGANLDFATGSDLTFQFTGVTYARIEVAALDALLPNLALPSIPDDDIAAGRIHIAYEYLYATSVVMTRADNKAFDGDVTAKLPQTVDANLRTKIVVDNHTQLTLSSIDPIAFAYKAGQLQRNAGRWHLRLTASLRDGVTPSKAPYLPAEDEVLEPT